MFLKGALNDLWGLFFTLQVLCYLIIYDTIIPSSAEMYLTEITKIIEFDIISPEGFIKIFKPEFDLRAFISGTKVAINKDQEVSIIKDLQVYILIVGAGLILLCFAGIGILALKKYREMIKNKLKSIKDKFQYNGALRSIYISFLEVCLSTALQLKLVFKGSKYVDSSSLMVSSMTSAYLYGVVFWMIYTLHGLKGQFEKETTRSKYENMY